MRIFRTIHLLLISVRYKNLAIILICQLFFAWRIELLEGPEAITKVLLLSLGTLLIAAGGYLINDYYDVKIDLVNEPQRVYIGEKIKRRHVLLMHMFLTSIGIGVGFFISYKLLALFIFAAGLLWLYSNQLKRLPLLGNLSIAFLSSLSFLSLIFLKTDRNVLFLLLLFSVFAFLMSLIREIIKDIEDMKGDKSFGCKTLPIVIGIRKSKLVIYASNILILFFLVFFTLRYFSENYLFLIYAGVIALQIFILSVLTFRADTKKHFTSLSKYCKFILLFGIFGVLTI